MEYKSNIGSIVQDLIVDLDTTLDKRVLSRVGANQLIGDMVRRIHFDGKDASDNAIGEYSTEPIYVSLDAFVRKKGKVRTKNKNGKTGSQRTLRPRGKNSNDPDFENGKRRKSRYFERGYLEYHDEMGNGNKVNLTLTGQLSNDLQVAPKGKNFGLGFSDYGMGIYPGLEGHFKVVIWSPTENEKDRILTAIEEYISKNLNN